MDERSHGVSSGGLREGKETDANSSDDVVGCRQPTVLYRLSKRHRLAWSRIG